MKLSFYGADQCVTGSCHCLEVNGNQNYITWDAQKALLPAGVRYADEDNGVFTLDSDFYRTSGKLFGENGYHAFFTKKS